MCKFLRYLTSNQDVTNSLYSESYTNVAVIFASIPDYLDFYTEAEVHQKGNFIFCIILHLFLMILIVYPDPEYRDRKRLKEQFGVSIYKTFRAKIRVGHFPCFEFPLEKGKYCEISPREKGKNREIFVLNSQYIKIDFIIASFGVLELFGPSNLIFLSI